MSTSILVVYVSFIPYFRLLVFGILVTLVVWFSFLSFFHLSHLALQNVNKDYIIFSYFHNFVTKSDRKPRTKKGMNETDGSKSALNSTILVLIRLYISPKLDFIWFCFTISYVLCQVIMIKIFWSRFLDLCWVHAHKLVKRISPKCISEILENLEVWNGMQINSFKNGISNLLEVLS